MAGSALRLLVQRAGDGIAAGVLPLLRRLPLRSQATRSDGAQYNREQQQSVPEAEKYYQDEDPQERVEHVTVREGHHGKREQRRSGAVSDRRADVPHGEVRPFRTVLAAGLARRVYERVCDVSRVVHAEADAQFQANARRDVDGQAPEIHETANVQEREKHAQEDPKASLQFGDQQPGHSHDAEQCQQNVALDLLSDQLVGDPQAEHLAPNGDETIDPDGVRHPLAFVHSRNPLVRSVKSFENEIYSGD